MEVESMLERVKLRDVRQMQMSLNRYLKQQPEA